MNYVSASARRDGLLRVPIRGFDVPYLPTYLPLGASPSAGWSPRARSPASATTCAALSATACRTGARPRSSRAPSARPTTGSGTTGSRTSARRTARYFLPAAKPTGQGKPRLLLLLWGGTILAYPCAFKRGVFREVCSTCLLAHVLSKEVCSEKCVQQAC